jgi:hypothetical protein
MAARTSKMSGFLVLPGAAALEISGVKFDVERLQGSLEESIFRETN